MFVWKARLLPMVDDSGQFKRQTDGWRLVCSWFGNALLVHRAHSNTNTHFSLCHVLPIFPFPPPSALRSTVSLPMSRTRCLAVCWRECQYFQYLSCSSRFLSWLKTTMITLCQTRAKTSKSRGAQKTSWKPHLQSGFFQTGWGMLTEDHYVLVKSCLL